MNKLLFYYFTINISMQIGLGGTSKLNKNKMLLRVFCLSLTLIFNHKYLLKKKSKSFSENIIITSQFLDFEEKLRGLKKYCNSALPRYDILVH